MKKEHAIQVSGFEWPTIGLLLANYVLWGICLLGYKDAPLTFSILLCLVLALQSSLTHELIHGHPTPSNALNLALGIVPITLFYPIHLFQETHLKHHQNEHLTLPGVDPESFFYCPVKWREMGKPGRLFAWINMTLAGRLLFAVPSTLKQVVCYCLRDTVSGSMRQRAHWVLHFALVCLVLTTIAKFQGMPLGMYILCAAVGHSAIALRAFFEHRPAPNPEHRIVIVNSNHFFRMLYLSNNLHAVHHKHPEIPWYRLTRTFEQTRSNVLNRNSNFFFDGYHQWLKFLFTPVHSPVHPGKPEQYR